jgi:hypothetical protein
LGYKINHCGFCGGTVPVRLVPIITHDAVVGQYNIKIDSIVYGYSVTVKAPYYCGNSACAGRSLNHNSIDFVTKAYNLSTEQALQFIHDRNRSPFYQNNHDSKESHIKSQSSYSKRQTREQTLQGVHKRSKDFLIARYGEDIGNKIFKETCQKKRITFDNLKRIYPMESDEQIEYRLIKWKLSCVNSKTNFIARHGSIQGNLKWLEYRNKQRPVCIHSATDLEKWLIDFFSNISLNLMRSRPIKSFLNKQYWVENACLEFFEKSMDDVLIDFLKKYSEFDVFEGRCLEPDTTHTICTLKMEHCLKAHTKYTFIPC